MSRESDNQRIIDQIKGAPAQSVPVNLPSGPGAPDSGNPNATGQLPSAQSADDAWAELSRQREADEMMAAIERGRWSAQPVIEDGKIDFWEVYGDGWFVTGPTLREALAAAMKRQEGGK